MPPENPGQSKHDTSDQQAFKNPLETGVSFLVNLAPHAHWLLRFGLASVFLFHGISKFFTAGMLSEMMGMPVAMILMLGVMETTAGALAMAGGFRWSFADNATRLAGLVIIPIMLGAIFMVHWPQWHFAPSETHPMGGMQFQVTLLLLALYIVIKGNKIAQT